MRTQTVMFEGRCFYMLRIALKSKPGLSVWLVLEVWDLSCDPYSLWSYPLPPLSSQQSVKYCNLNFSDYSKGAFLLECEVYGVFYILVHQCKWFTLLHGKRRRTQIASHCCHFGGFFFVFFFFFFKYYNILEGGLNSARNSWSLWRC